MNANVAAHENPVIVLEAEAQQLNALFRQQQLLEQQMADEASDLNGSSGESAVTLNNSSPIVPNQEITSQVMTDASINVSQKHYPLLL